MNITLFRAAFIGLFLGSTLTGSAQIDCLGVNGGNSLPGTPCDDGQPYTSIDRWSVNCVCVGMCGSDSGPIGTPEMPCDDGNASTSMDTWTQYCDCCGYCPNALPGAPCDDGDPNTINDVIDMYGCYCRGTGNTIAGQVFLDVDLDGVFGGSDQPIAMRTVQAAPGRYTNTDAYGAFSFDLTPGYYTLLASSGSFDAPAQVNPVLDLSVPGSSSIGNALAMDASAMQVDLSVHINARNPGPNSIREVIVVCKNDGTLPMDGTVSLTFDPSQSISYQFPEGIVSTNTISWPVPVLPLGATFVAHAWLFTQGSTPLGTLFQYSALIQATSGDVLPANDQDTRQVTVSSSYDPNDITVDPDVLEMTDIAAGTPLTYTIRFQNTGNAPAEDIRVTDALPMQVRHSSVEMVAASYPCHMQLDDGLLQFHFDGIMLPDSVHNEPESHGFVMFTVRPQNFLLPGAVVGNMANIYFDQNTPVATNTASFNIPLNTSVPDEVHQDLKVWPVPAADLVNIGFHDARSWSVRFLVTDAAGRVVMTAVREPGIMQLPVADLPPGIYAVRAEQQDRVLTRRFVVVH